ncbi:MAG: methylated-DNA/protein-cysteinemethyltransferase [Firmicutes bacterium]|nr:methylated-DNA/protein-cysteinemethyltransferase [Bacillota bacterium]
MVKSIFVYQTDIGALKIAENGTAITNLYFSEESLPQQAVVQETELLKEAAQQLTEYFSGRRKDFSVPLAPSGTVFMQCVWAEVEKIPYGESQSYKGMAQRIGRPKAVRAIGMANNKNPIPIFIPCHRVIGVNGNLIGYRGGLKIKKQLLELERQYKK